MGRQATSSTLVTPEHVEAYLRSHGWPDARIRELRPLGQSTQAGLKAYGYGRPLCVVFTARGKEERVVVRTMSPDPFGHERRADRVGAMVLSFDTFASVPRHIRPMDVGTFADDGALVSTPAGEPFLVTEYVDGELYAQDLAELAKADAPRPLDLERAEALAEYLAALHAERADPALYARFLRDTIGGGEGIFGQVDGYPEDDEVAPPSRLEAIEAAANRWRWHLRAKKHRARRTHGDFHPFNLLFREGCDLSVLDASRGGVGEPADDVTCLAVNYLFFGFARRGHFEGPERRLWEAFWRRYLDASRDAEVLEVTPPFFAWRLLVLASPVWYPDLSPDTRERLLGLAESLLGGVRFYPDALDDLLA